VFSINKQSLTEFAYFYLLFHAFEDVQGAVDLIEDHPALLALDELGMQFQVLLLYTGGKMRTIVFLLASLVDVRLTDDEHAATQAVPVLNYLLTVFAADLWPLRGFGFGSLLSPLAYLLCHLQIEDF